MINQRTIALLQAPEQIQADDLSVLEKEISNFPYIQSLRALYLYGTHRFNEKDYKTLLTSTAAYTTDKKILYQFINKEQIKVQVEKAIEAKLDVVEKVIPTATQTLKSKYEAEKPTFPKIKNEVETVNVAKDLAQEIPVNNNIEEVIEEPLVEEVISEPTDVVENTIEETAPIIESIVPTEEVVELNDTFDEENVEIQETYSDTVELQEEFTPTEIVETVHSAMEEEVVENDSNISFQEVESLELESIDEVHSTHVEELLDKQDEVIDEVENQSEEDSSQLSYYDKYDHLPKINIGSIKEDHITALPQQNPERHLSEMERLIAEVEQKIKTKKQNEPVSERVLEEEPVNTDISFAENFDEPIAIAPVQEVVKIAETKVEEIKEAKELVVEEVIEEKPIETILAPSEWKPLNFETHLPDALIGKVESIKKEGIKEEIVMEVKEKMMVETKEAVEEEISSIKVETEEERPVLNVSFFSETVKPFEAEESKSIVEDLKIQNESLEEDSNSNIPKFINTWQSWLNIEKTEPAIDETLEDDIVEETIVEEVEEKVPEVIKNKAIETFIETNPKISKMKEESDFIVKERSENISHLMTETLAMLYVQQKLYTKAIGGFQILIEKHPEKTEYFQEKIQEVKNLRSGK